MARFLSGFVSPWLLLTAAFLSRSLLSLVNLIAFLVILYGVAVFGTLSTQRSLSSWFLLVYNVLVLLSFAMFYIILAIIRDHWTVENAQWAKLIGFVSLHHQGAPLAIGLLVIHLVLVLIALFDLYGNSLRLEEWSHSVRSFLVKFERIGSKLRFACCMFLPCIQLALGISHPSWISLPYFIGSCIGLVDWSLTSNVLGLFIWRNYLLPYAGSNIVLLYIYQLPMEFSDVFKWFAEFIGLYRISSSSTWSEVFSGTSLLLFYIMLGSGRCVLAEMDNNLYTKEDDLTEPLLPSSNFLLPHQSRSGIRRNNLLLRGTAFQTFMINFFIYGFPVSLFAISYWSSHFASLYAFGLLAYVGYILYAFPSLFRLHRLNGLLLMSILFWATCTYIFYLAFTYFNKEIHKDMEIWETIGFWHYSVPGFYLFVQFCLGVLVALGNLVNSSVFVFVNEEGKSFHGNTAVEENQETKVLIVATIVWVFKKCSRTIVLILIVVIAIRPGFFHALYMIFFMMYMLRPSIDRKMRQALILLCEIHFALLYILQFNLFSKVLKHEGSWPVKILSQLGLVDDASGGDVVKIVLLACFCAIHNHGFELLFSFSAILQHAPSLPFGFSILKAGLNKSVLLSVYTSESRVYQPDYDSRETRIAMYLGVIGKQFLSIYHSFGTYIAFLTILITVYLVPPNYISFGYLFGLLFWITGRQIMGSTVSRLWLPLKAYSIAVFLFRYSLSVFLNFRSWLSGIVDLYPAFGFDQNASALRNIWHSLAVVIVMQLHSYERRKSSNSSSDNHDVPDYNTCSFMRRLLILHNEKILLVSLFYASLSPVSTFGLVYLFGLLISSTSPKSSQGPSKFFLVYSGIHLMGDYLFQIWGGYARMFPGQKNYYISQFIGLQLFKPGFWGLESGLRGKILVVFACMLQYIVFRWVERLPGNLGNGGKWEEIFTLFGPASQNSDRNVESEVGKTFNPVSHKQEHENISAYSKSSSPSPFEEPKLQKVHLNKCYAESSEGTQNWDRKQVAILKKERLKTQKSLLKLYIKFWVENMFNLFGLEINMIALLLCSFALLNSISLLYVAALAACILLNRNVIKKWWPTFVVLFALVLVLEYLADYRNLTSLKLRDIREPQISCHDCWKNSNVYYDYCLKCWLGLIVDDHRMLIGYWAVFMLSCFKLRADQLSSLSMSYVYQQIMSISKNSCVFSDLSFETKCIWTSLDYLRLESYCHLLDFVLSLILVTGTLEYDILHLGYLGFALVFFRMRLEILKKKNYIFRWLRIYNFALIMLSLAYQSPFARASTDEKCETSEYIYKIIGFYKYDYGFRITSRSALVEIIIFALIFLQSCMFESKEFDYVSKYLEEEQIRALLSEQENKAAWKTKQLLHIRRVEELKHQRNMQVEKMKAEMLNLQTMLHQTLSSGDSMDTVSQNGSLGRRKISLTLTPKASSELSKDEIATTSFDSLNFEIPEVANLKVLSPKESRDQVKDSQRIRSELKENSVCDFDDLDEIQKEKLQNIENPLISAVQLLGDGVSQVQCIGNMAVNNLASLLNIDTDDLNPEGNNDMDGVCEKVESQNAKCQGGMDRTSSSMHSDGGFTEALHAYISMLLRYIWAQMRSRNDIVCYCCFVLIFLWNFSLLSVVYLSALFLYALCVHDEPSSMFWLSMLIYTELCILVQYLYQITIQQCGFSIQLSFLREFGFPEHKVTSSFVISIWPFFLVYLFTLLQSSISARDLEWTINKDFGSFRKKECDIDESRKSSNWLELLFSFINVMKLITRALYRYWKSLTEGSETPPYFVQLSMRVEPWPEEGIQPEKVEIKINKLLKLLHIERCKGNDESCITSSRIRVQSIEQSPENPNIALAVLEVIYASSLVEGIPLEWYHSLTPAADVAEEFLKAQHSGKFEEIGFPYPVLSVIWGGKREIDLYACVFCVDLLVFFLVAIFYQSVIKSNSEFLEVYQLEDQFPKEFVYILMIIFFLIVVDRVIYLCIFPRGKVIFYMFNLVLFTCAATKYAWSMDPLHQHAGAFALRAIFLMKAISLALQAVQIRYGIPNKGTLYQQFLTSNVSRINYLAFRVYRALPFLHELRCVLDWSCTTTSLTMYDWLKLEDIHSSLFLVKCDVDLNRVHHQQGQRQTKLTKLCSGICLFLVLICAIWTPMLMYSSGNPTNIANPIKEASVRVDIKTVSGRLTLFEITLCEKLSWNELGLQSELDPHGYLSSYDKEDIQLISCQSDASSMWLVPPVVQARFGQSLNWGVDVIFSWQFVRDRPKEKEVVRYEVVVQDKDSPKAEQVIEVLNGTSHSFNIYNIYPRYFRVTGSGDVRLLEDTVAMVSATLTLHKDKPGWWSFHDMNPFRIGDYGGPTGPVAVIVSEETPQGILGETLSHFSIWGLYVTFVLALGRFIRLQFSDLRMRIPYENLPSCDRLLAICENIYAARAEGELEVEEVLYWTLVKIYRSPHMLLEYTKPD